ncbi:MAG: HlyD family efflux transporter periplasmic adaptor subunit [Bacteroidota bacterium]
MRKKILITLLLAFLALSAWFFIYRQSMETARKDSPDTQQQTANQPGEKQEEESEPEVTEKENTQITPSNTYSFVLRPSESRVVKFTIPGVLETAKNISPGDRFSKNELIFQLDNSALFAEISRKKTELRSKLENLYEQLSRETPEAYPKWHAYGEAITETDLLPPLPENISSKERSLINSAGIVPLSMQIAQKEQEIFSYFYLAPFDGRIRKIFVHPGKRISAGQAVAAIYPDETMRLQRKIHIDDLRNYTGKQQFRLENRHGKLVAGLNFKAGKQSGDSVVVTATVASGKLELFDFFQTIEVKNF